MDDRNTVIDTYSTLIDDISTFSLTGKAQNLEQIRIHWNAIVSIR